MNKPPTAKPPGGSFHGKGRDMHRSTRHVKFRAMLWHRNPMCQCLGVCGKHTGACHHMSVILHHLLDPVSRPDLQFVTSNCAMLCRECHPNTPGTPHWQVGVDYIRTVGLGDPQLSEEEFKVG